MNLPGGLHPGQGSGPLHFLTGTVVPAFCSAISNPISQPQLMERKYLDQHLVRKHAQAPVVLMIGHDYSRPPTWEAHSQGASRKTGRQSAPPGTSSSHPAHARKEAGQNRMPLPLALSPATTMRTLRLRLVQSGGWKPGAWGLTDLGEGYHLLLGDLGGIYLLICNIGIFWHLLVHL